MERELIVNWIYQASDLDLEEKLHIPGENRPACLRTIRRFIKELDIFYQINPEKAGTISVAYSFKDSSHWIVLSRVKGNPFVGFVKRKGGEVERIDLERKKED
jgi:hypothetical protein